MRSSCDSIGRAMAAVPKLQANIVKRAMTIVGLSISIGWTRNINDIKIFI